MQKLASLLIVLLILPAKTSADNWSRFRGPNGTGVSASTDLPAQFHATRNLIWKSEPGKGTSSPILFENRLYLTSFEGTDRFVRCFDATSGAALWNQSVRSTRREITTPPCGPATPSPTAAPEGVFAFFPDFGIVGYSHEGDLLWKTQVEPFQAFHGIASSLVIAAGNVLVQADQLQGSYVAAFSLKDGSEVWRQERIDGTTAGYSTPSVLRRDDGTSEIVLSGPLEVVGYDAESGNRLWWINGLTNAPISLPLVSANRVILCEPFYATNPFKLEDFLEYDKDKDGKVSVKDLESQPIVHRMAKHIDNHRGNADGVVSENELTKAFASFVNSGGLVSVRADATGSLLKEHVDWAYTKKVPQVASTIVYRDVLYFVNDGGILVAIDIESGDVLKRARLGKGGRKYDASPVAADGKLFLADVDGMINVVEAQPKEALKATDKWTILATNNLSEPIHATPAIANNRIYVRTETSLFCFGK